MRRTGPVVAALTAIAYLPALANRYAFDDVYIVQRDRLIRGLAGIPALFHQDWWAPFGRMGLYRPLAKATFAVGWALAPASPGWYHLVNILLHAVAAVLVFRLARRWLPEWFAVAAGVWFGVVPSQTEVVASLVGRADLMATVFALAGLLAFVRVQEGSHAGGAGMRGTSGAANQGCRAPKAGALRPWLHSQHAGSAGMQKGQAGGGGNEAGRQASRAGVRMTVWAGLCMFCSLLSKESGIVLPGLAVLAGWALPQAEANEEAGAKTDATTGAGADGGEERGRRRWRPRSPGQWQRAWRRIVGPFANPALWTITAAALVYLAIRIRVVGLLTHAPDFGENALWFLGPATRVRTAVVVMLHSFGAWLWPFGLAPDYSWPQIRGIRTWASPEFWTAVIIFAALGAVLWRLRRHRVVLFGVGFALLAYLPVSNLLFAIGTIRANRLLYLPSVGAALVFGWLCQQVVGYASRLARDGRSGEATVGYASRLVEGGGTAAPPEVERKSGGKSQKKAARAGRRQEVKSENPSAWKQLWGRPRARAALVAVGLLFAVYMVTDLHESMYWKDNATLFAMGVERSPNSSRMRYSLGVELQHEGHLKASVAQLRRALALYPNYAQAAGALGDSFKQAGRDRAALEAYRRAWKLKRDDDNFLQVGDEELKLGDYAGVLRDLSKLPEAKSPASALPPLVGLAVGLAQLRLGQAQQAVATLAPVVAALPDNARAHLYYGEALHAAGDNQAAAEQLRWLARNVPAGRSGG